MKKALSLILVCLFLVSMMIPVSAAQFINAYETIQAENYSEASCASVLGLGSTHYLENCLDAGGGKMYLTGRETHISSMPTSILDRMPPMAFRHELRIFRITPI